MELLLFHWSEAIFVFSLGKCVRYTNLPCVFLSTNTRSNSHLYSLQTDIESCPLWVEFSKQISCIFLTILKMFDDFMIHETLPAWLETLTLQQQTNAPILITSLHCRREFSSWVLQHIPQNHYFLFDPSWKENTTNRAIIEHVVHKHGYRTRIYQSISR